MRILVVNGPNLNMLEKRDATHYGSFSLGMIEESLSGTFPEIEFEMYQSNIEGEIVGKLQSADANYNGIVINPAAYSHYSLAIRDALELCNIPKIEVHLSNIHGREEFRQHSVTAAACNGVVAGLKEISYIAAVFALNKMING
ncbi:MAG: 3-dehydroquinate dehydratase [Ignavibacteria bacterium]|nr:3-dehydroquinate dehydratase [Ignavibacteria bacterium]